MGHLRSAGAERRDRFVPPSPALEGGAAPLAGTTAPLFSIGNYISKIKTK